MLLSGGQDDTKGGRTTYVGLYKGTPPTNSNAVQKNSANWIEAIALDGKGEGSVSFTGLAFDETVDDKRVPITYHVFELAPTSESTGDDLVTIDGQTYKPVTGSTAQFTFGNTTREYVVSADDKAQVLSHETPAATVDITNSYTQRGKLAFREVDKDTWDQSTLSAASNLAGAAFTLTQLDVDVNYDSDSPTYSGAFNNGNGGNGGNGDPIYKAKGVKKTSVLTNAQGVATIADLADGIYEGKEATAPPGYLIVGDSTFYVEVRKGQLRFLEKSNGNGSSVLTLMDNPSSYSNPNGTNVLAYTEETRSGSEVTTPAVVTIGDSAGSELPSTGGPGLWSLHFAGVVASAAALALERRRA